MPFLSLLAKIASHPLVAGVLIPSIAQAIQGFLEKMASRCERRAAVTQAQAAKTAEELRDASKRLSDSTRR